MRTRRSLIDLDDLSADELNYIFERAAAFEERLPGKLLADEPWANMFFEPSTRTFASFNLAQHRLGAYVINLSPSDLSLSTKGETIEDTVITLGAMGIAGIVVRHSQPGFPAEMAQAFDGHIVNAGDGAHAHPTQALLDLFTLRSEFGATLSGRTVAIVGDVVHSRVAHSSILGMLRLGIDVVLVGPPEFLPPEYVKRGVRVEREFDAVIGHCDAILLLRMQRERFDGLSIDHEQYIERYQLNGKRLQNVRPETIVMHPGPYNRGVELDTSVLQFAGWRYAVQVHHGVSIRMAVLDFLTHGAR